MRLADFLNQVYVPSRLELSVGAIRQMAVSVRVWSHFLGRQAILDDLTEDALRRFLTVYRQDHAAATTNSKRCQLLALWQCAWEEGRHPQPPRRSKIRKAKAQPRIPEAWSPEEVGRILMVTRQTTGKIADLPASAWWTSLLLTFYDTGERRSAVLASAPANISLSEGWIVFVRTKTGIPRWCALHDDTIHACREIWDDARQRFWPWPYSREWLDDSFRKILKRASVRHGPEHGGLFQFLRRTSGTLVEANGGDGAKHIGNTRAVFERHYRDPRFFASQLDRLPRPTF